MLPITIQYTDRVKPFVPKLVIFFLILLSGCQFLKSAFQSSPDGSEDSILGNSGIHRIYIQSFTGQNVEQVQKVFFETVSHQDQFSFVELLPDDYQGLKILRIEVTDYSFWENDEQLDLVEQQSIMKDSVPDQVLRRNAIVGFRVSLYEAETGKLLLRKPYSQPFQQIYVGKDEIEKMPDKSQELEKLTKTLVYKLLNDFSFSPSDPSELELEKGYGHDWISTTFHNLGDGRIKKGNRLAQAGEYERAIWVWQLVLFRAAEGEPLDIYQKNRASAYFNLGVIYQKLGDIKRAAEMYSMANRMDQQRKYAQIWGDTMMSWLESQKDSSDQVNRLKPKQTMEVSENKPTEPSQPVMNKQQLSKSELLRRIEKSDQLLLKARELWPLEPSLKFSDTPEIKPKTEESPNVIIDEMTPETKEGDMVQPSESDINGNLKNQLIKVVPQTTN